jgi:hypothetical protein
VTAHEATEHGAGRCVKLAQKHAICYRAVAATRSCRCAHGVRSGLASCVSNRRQHAVCPANAAREQPLRQRCTATDATTALSQMHVTQAAACQRKQMNVVVASVESSSRP